MVQRYLRGTCISKRFQAIYSEIKNTAMPMRYHTRGMASIEINAPNTAVNPQMNTIKCKWR
jgi:hypothetical protein